MLLDAEDSTAVVEMADQRHLASSTIPLRLDILKCTILQYQTIMLLFRKICAVASNLSSSSLTCSLQTMVPVTIFQLTMGIPIPFCLSRSVQFF